MRLSRYRILTLGLLSSALVGAQPGLPPATRCAAAAGGGLPLLPPMERHLAPLATGPGGTPSNPSGPSCGVSLRPQPTPFVVRLVHQDGIPDSRSDGSAVTANGLTVHLRGGATVTRGTVGLRLAPELTYEQNVGFETAPGADADRSPLASPFYVGAQSADLPSRFGVRPRRIAVHLGESGLWWRPASAMIGISSGYLPWGPRAGEGLVIGHSAPGVPRLEGALRGPGRLRSLHLRAFGGVVVESPYFDADRTNDRRRLSGLRLEWATPSSPLRFGVSRTLMDGRRSPRWHETLTAPFRRAATDSLIDFTSVDAEWRDPARGSWGWLELARQVPITSTRDLLRHPTEGLALRLGGSQTLVTGPARSWVVSAEFVRLDQPQQRTDRPEQDLYTSATLAHGWTHRGQPLGSGLGPGGQRQLLGIDRVGRQLRVGGFLERARWNDGMVYRQFLTGPFRHDVSIVGGIHVARSDDPDRWSVRLGVGRRLNYLFQNAQFNPGFRTADLPLLRLHLTLTL